MQKPQEGEGVPLLMDGVYKGNETRNLAAELIFISVVPFLPQKTNRLEPWDYDRKIYNRRNVQRAY